MQKLSTEWLGLLTFSTLVAFKLTGIIEWPWIWVLSPLWAYTDTIFALHLVIFVAWFATRK